MVEMKSVIAKNEKYRVEVTENVRYSKFNINEFIQTFEALKKDGFIDSDSFSDITWYMPCPVQHKPIKFNFNSKLSNPLKAYLCVRRMSGIAPRNLVNTLARLKSVIAATDNLNNESLVRDYFSKPTSQQLYATARELLNFLHFYPVPDIYNTVNGLVDNLYVTQNSRDLPNFYDVLTFDDAVNQYFYHHSIEETYHFYPVLLWWSITNIIPLRPVEFVHIKADCLHSKEDGSLWITLPRFKMRGTSLTEHYWEQEILIPWETFNLIKQFIEFSRYKGITSTYLIPKMHKINDRFRLTYRVTEDISTVSQLNNIIYYFYEEVLEKKYGEYMLERITPGDTRHFAIINMFLQGFNILSITRLAGHEELESPSNYYSHAEHFVKSFVYKLAQKKLEGVIGSKMGDGFIGVTRQKVERARFDLISEEELKKYRQVDYGYCKDKDFPRNCSEYCRNCDYYEFKPNINEWKEGIDWLESYSNELQKSISDALSLLATLSLDTHQVLKEMPSVTEEESKSVAVLLFKYLDHKAIIDARLLEEAYEYE